MKTMAHIHVFLSAAPSARSSSSIRMHLSSISRDCSGSYLDRSIEDSTARDAMTAGDSEDIGRIAVVRS